MQVSELEALRPGERIRVTIDDSRHQTWVMHDNGTFTYNSVFASPVAFTAACIADRVQVITNNDLTFTDLPKYRFAPAWVDHPSRSEWARAMGDEVFGGVPYEMRTDNYSGYDTAYTCLIKQEAHVAFREVDERTCREYGIPTGLVGTWFRFIRNVNVEALSARESVLHGLPARHWAREPMVNCHGTDMGEWFGDQQVAEFKYVPVENTGSYRWFVIAPEGVTSGGFTVTQELCDTYAIPLELIGIFGHWGRPDMVAPTEEEIAEQEAARARQEEWVNAQPQYRVAPRVFRNWPEDRTVINLTANGQSWVGIIPREGEGPRNYGLWEVTEERQRMHSLPLETIGMWGYWLASDRLTLVTEADPLAEWLESLPKARYTDRGDDHPAGDYRSDRPECAYVTTGRDGGTGGILLAERSDRTVGWGFWNDSDMLPFIPEHLHQYMGERLLGWWVDPRFVDVTFTPEQVEAQVQARIAEAVEQATAEMRRLTSNAQAEAERQRVHVQRLAEALRTMLDDHDYDYGCRQDELLAEVGYEREAPTETIWVEVKITGEGEYEVDDSEIERSYDHNIATEQSSYVVSFNWEREARFDSIQVEEGTCVCGDDPDDVIGNDYIRERLSGLNLPGIPRDWEFGIVNCENG